MVIAPLIVRPVPSPSGTRSPGFEDMNGGGGVGRAQLRSIAGWPHSETPVWLPKIPIRLLSLSGKLAGGSRDTFHCRNTETLVTHRVFSLEKNKLHSEHHTKCGFHSRPDRGLKTKFFQEPAGRAGRCSSKNVRFSCSVWTGMTATSCAMLGMKFISL